ncbi:MAG: hypothetical protein MUD12_12190 [Spirochaetes bacterium]|jgi:hypothetical protein|nr:hypothetical protein [Spirochaetota bacterium]
MHDDEKKIRFYKKVNGFTGPLSRTNFYLRTKVMARILAKISLLKNKARPKETVKEIAEEWCRMFGLPQYWKIRKIEDDTAFCEIHFDCSLEKTGDIHACHRLMEFDRAMLKRIGGKCVILESRADPRIKGPCLLAIRKLDDLREDLVPAHMR